VAFLQAVDAEGLIWLEVFSVAVSVGAVGAKVMPGLGVAHFAALKASVGIAAGHVAGVRAVGGTGGAERGDACVGVFNREKANDLGAVSWEADAISEGQSAIIG
jgi:hypothetical protein